MRFVSLFAGIGGLDLGLERAGHECVGQVEIDSFATSILEKHWPDTPRLRDVRDFEGHEFGSFDLLVAGYPCQPFSYAGDQKGDKHQAHLWPEVLRVVRKIRPRFLLLENVVGHLSVGFDAVLGDLAESGYDATWNCLSAAAFGAPHERDRLWIVAYPHGDGQSVISLDDETFFLSPSEGASWPEWTPDPETLGMDDGISRGMDRKALKALGNAVVPHVAEWIGRRLEALSGTTNQLRDLTGVGSAC